jgi:pantoate--beta-alanine ligase
MVPEKKLQVVESIDALSGLLQSAREQGKSIGLVPTMGALHAGHLSLVDAAARDCALVVVTIFVNPTQFNDPGDLARYPRDLAADVDLLSRRGCDIVFAPSVETMYTPHHATFVEPAGAALTLEGDARPGHFRGVATIVLKLFNLVAADVAYFGRKDYQQALVVQQLVRDLDVSTAIKVLPTVREADGLAMSSRNARLSPEERRRALAIPQGLEMAAELAAGGQRRAETIRARVLAHLASAGIEADYVEIVAEGTVTPVDAIEGPAVVLVAACVGKTRLIDNRSIG